MFLVIPTKIKFLTLLIVFFSLVECRKVQAYSIVFAHLGDALPSYVSNATHQARLFNEDADIYVILEAKALENIVFEEFDGDKILFIACEDLKRSSAHIAFNRKTNLDVSFRQGFWRKTTERFFLVHELMEQYDLEDVFHLEYDNMLYADLHALLPVFHKYSNIAATFDNDDRCIAGFIYFSHANALEKLVNFIANQANFGLNDMQIIARYKKQYGDDEIANLPIIMSAYGQRHPLRSQKGHVAKAPEDYMKHFALFESIFDAAALGQYLGGIDPRNGLSKPGFINESCLFDPSLLDFEWIQDAQGRKVPHAKFENKLYPINNLHIHSKNLKAFAS